MHQNAGFSPRIFKNKFQEATRTHRQKGVTPPAPPHAVLAYFLTHRLPKFFRRSVAITAAAGAGLE